MDQGQKLKEYMLKEIEIIQDIIKRIAFNSFMIKGLAITLIVITLLIKQATSQIWIAFIPFLSFWFLDAYFLWQERMYRKLYDWVRQNRLKTEEYLFDMDAYRFKKEVAPRLKVMFSITLSWFYLSIVVLILVYAFLVRQ